MDEDKKQVEESLEKIRKRMALRTLKPIGACHFCNGYIRDNRLFCCKECSDDWERVNEVK